MSAPQSHPLAGLALGFAGVLIFGATLPMTRIALGGFDPVFLTFARAVIASAVASVALLMLRRNVPRRLLGQISLAGALLVYGFPLLSSIAMQTVPAAHGGIVLGILPLLTAVFAALFGGERPGPLFWLLSLTGAGLVLAFTLLSMEPAATEGAGSGDLWLLFAALSAACGYVLFGRLSRQLPGWEVIAWALIVTAPLSIAGTAWTWASGVHAPGAGEMAALAYLGLGSMFLGFVFWNAGLAMGGIARVGQVQLLQTFVTLGISALLLGETVTPLMLGFALAVGWVVWLGRKARITAASDTAREPPKA